jgi:hypothetical protein
MPPKVLALPREEIDPRLYATGLSDRDIRALLQNDEWGASQLRNQQLVFFAHFAQTECSRRLSAAILARVFGIQDAQVWKIESKARQGSKPAHRLLALSPEQEDAIVALIEIGYHNGNFTTHRDILNFVESEFGKCLIYSWLHSFLTRNESRVCSTVVSP